MPDQPHRPGPPPPFPGGPPGRPDAQPPAVARPLPRPGATHQPGSGRPSFTPPSGGQQQSWRPAPAPAHTTPPAWHQQPAPQQQRSSGGGNPVPKRKPPKKKGNRWIKIALAVLGLLLVLKVAVDNLVPAPEPAAPPKAELKPPAPVKPANEWSQRYNVTFLYSNQRLVIDNVHVTRLRAKKPTVTYTLTAITAGNPLWIQDERYWRMGALGLSARPTKIKDQRIGHKHTMKVTFRWPRERLHGGSSLVMTIPNEKETRANVVRLALEIPEKGNGIEERTGAGGL